MSSDRSSSVIVDTLKQLSLENREFMRDTIDILEPPVDPCTFLRQYVATNTPVLIQDAINHWPASRLWTQQYLSRKAGQTEISVELTPNGLGDAVTAIDDPAARGKGECFCMPCSSKMLFQQFCDIFFNSKADVSSQSSAAPTRQIPYLSQQNSNLTVELPQLLEDVDDQLDFAAAAFGASPDAVNLWIGDERASTTFHKDHYENLYAVVRGTKIFHLLPPIELYRMSLQFYPAARYEAQDDGHLKPVLQKPRSSVLWCPIHPEPEDWEAARAQYPLYFDSSLPAPLRVEVHAGDVLYLPAMWWHYVEQRGCPDQQWCVAVNYWYDMQFDSRYAAYRMVEKLAQQAGLVPMLGQLEEAEEDREEEESKS